MEEKMIKLENDYIELKELDFNYIMDMFEYSSDERVGKFSGFIPHQTKEEALDMMSMLKDKNEVWGIYHKQDKKLIGTIGVHSGGKHPIHKIEVNGMGFELNPKYWGKGIMSMACDLALEHFFLELGGEVIYANHFDFNIRSKRFITKYGMEFEGHWYSKSKQFDNSIYKMTKDNFINNRKNTSRN